MGEAEMRALLMELRALRKIVEERSDLGAVRLERAAALLDVTLVELKSMGRTGLIETVKYGPKGEARIPLSEIRRLTVPRPRV